MRRDIKEKLDAIDRTERIRRRVFWITIPILIALGAALYYRPSEYVGVASGTVERSVIGVNEFGSWFHQLSVRLDNNQVVPVRTFLKSPIKLGRQIKIARRRGWMGNIFYRLEPKQHQQPSQTR